MGFEPTNHLLKKSLRSYKPQFFKNIGEIIIKVKRAEAYLHLVRACKACGASIVTHIAILNTSLCSRGDSL